MGWDAFSVRPQAARAEQESGMRRERTAGDFVHPISRIGKAGNLPFPAVSAKISTGSLMSVAFRSAKEANLRGAKGDNSATPPDDCRNFRYDQDHS